jgi:3D (Asp-Asp-Asp) domain-containing protein
MGNGAVSLAPKATEIVPVAATVVRNVAIVEKKISGILREVTAYNVGVREQTSDTPCIGAGGHNLCELLERGVKVCAANFVPLGTVLRIEKYGEYIVLDRTHRRFSHRVDIAMKEDEIDDALRFGLQKRLVEARF